MQFPFKPRYDIPGLSVPIKASGVRAEANLPLRKAEVAKLKAGSYTTDQPNRTTRRAQQKEADARHKQEQQKLRAMTPLKRAQHQHWQWLESLRGIVLKIGNPLEAPVETERGVSWFFRVTF